VSAYRPRVLVVRSAEVEELFGEFRVPQAQEEQRRGERMKKLRVKRPQRKRNKGRGPLVLWKFSQVWEEKVRKLRREYSSRRIGRRKISGPLGGFSHPGRRQESAQGKR
jgi:hypothetical protein